MIVHTTPGKGACQFEERVSILATRTANPRYEKKQGEESLVAPA
jgi:hypothetical protein